MSHQVLVAGCSFLDVGMRHPIPPWDGINYKKYLFRGDVAAGNQAIAARIRYELLQNNFEKVIVLWSGINRIDFSMTKGDFDTLPNTYRFVSKLGDEIWYLSGGICGSWQLNDDCPPAAKQRFKNEFMYQTKRSASDATFKAIVETQKHLDELGIEYVMSFIYDIHADYNGVLDVNGNKFQKTGSNDRWPEWLALEHCLGQADADSEWYDLVDWTKFPAEQTPYEYCIERGLVEVDRFHPSKDGLKEWFRTQLDVYLTDS